MGIINTNSDKDLSDGLLSRRHRLFQRLRETEENPYHNIDHTLDVHDRLALLLRHLREKNSSSSNVPSDMTMLIVAIAIDKK
jgi:hypothetical protein